jgi:hypothetical protein
MKNTANIDIFAQITPFRRSAAIASIAASGQIDENRALPYKPRQLSAMARFDRGGSFWAGNGPLWARQHRRTYLIIRQVVSLTGKLSAENDP